MFTRADAETNSLSALCQGNFQIRPGVRGECGVMALSRRGCSGLGSCLCSLHPFPNWLLLYLSEPRFPHLSNGIETIPKLTWAICLLEGKTLENRSQTLGEEMDGLPVGFGGFLGVLPGVFIPRFSRTMRVCLEQCWRTGASPLSPPIRGDLPCSRSPEEGLAIQGDHTHPLLTPWSPSQHLHCLRTPRSLHGNCARGLLAGGGPPRDLQDPGGTWHQSPDAGSPCKPAVVSYRSVKTCGVTSTPGFAGSTVRYHRGTLNFEVWICPILAWMTGCCWLTILFIPEPQFLDRKMGEHPCLVSLTSRL